MSLLGPGGINARVAQLQSSLDALSPKETPPAGPKGGFQSHLDGAMPPTLSGSIGSGGAAMPMAVDGLRPLIDAAAERNGVPSDLLAALVQQESGGDPNAVSRCGAQGLTQLMPKTAAGLGVIDPFDPEQSLDGGARYLKQQLDRFGGKPDLALAAYNAGPSRVEGRGFAQWPLETRNYVTSIMRRMRGG